MTIDENNTDSVQIAGSVIMLMGQHCSYCGPMMMQLSELMKSGQISQMQIINIEQNPELAKQYHARSVPWLKIGPFVLEGMRSKAELLQWLQRANAFAKGGEAARDYFDEILAEGNIKEAERLIDDYPEALSGVIELIADADAKINVRLGAGVIIEARAQQPEFEPVIPRLIEYLHHEDARVRGDACHYLSLTGKAELGDYIQPLLEDASAEVREIAQESLDSLAGN